MINKDYNIKYKAHLEEMKANPDLARENFLKNLKENDELRHEFWNNMYGRKFIKATGRPDKIKIIEAENEWNKMNDDQLLEWYNYITDDGKTLGVIGEINYIVQLLKLRKGNMKKIWADLKKYGKIKKEEQKNEDGI